MVSPTITDYSNATVRFPHLLKTLEAQLSEKDWTGAEQTRLQLDNVSAQLGEWLKHKAAAPTVARI